ncbi:MAG TPA: peptidoglycan DD-metalloendopeptidase family protein [Candidatus Hydrogenedentes bacterium]|nr:peptidoglycan DD-metalloendopeptidase family protein [Candidatus Hydrogenedentota bacterium]HOL76933.1 peptidoglycan DD-metalloendopeptidase family protein [Candidatus Hydrogenedentota bacterium]HPO87303.1 peptidoglycan DD-metalloendopeptidase family protein [Candidatus Hydrogenedentota bacterium]
MKRWAVMLVPHGCGKTHTLDVSIAHVWTIVAVFLFTTVLAACLAFTTTFLVERYSAVQAELKELRRENRDLAEKVSAKISSAEEALAQAEREEIERKVREEYEASNRAIAGELADLRDIEAQIREIQGLRPRVNSAADYISASTASENGKGGAPGLLGTAADLERTERLRPSSIIYGLSKPATDLIIQEIRLRTQSLLDLRDALLADRERTQRKPAIIPVANARGISSRFGYRRDPLTPTVRHHDGLDIAAPYGSTVVATGRGVVISAAYESYLGNTVRIDHGDGLVTVYAHLSSMSVSVGEHVNRGDEIGKVGTSGRTTGAHLHYEVRINGQPTNPELYLPRMKLAYQ